MRLIACLNILMEALAALAFSRKLQKLKFYKLFDFIYESFDFL